MTVTSHDLELLTICSCILTSTSSNEMGVKLLLSTPTSYCLGKSICNLGLSKPVMQELV